MGWNIHDVFVQSPSTTWCTKPRLKLDYVVTHTNSGRMVVLRYWLSLTLWQFGHKTVLIIVIKVSAIAIINPSYFQWPLFTVRLSVFPQPAVLCRVACVQRDVAWPASRGAVTGLRNSLQVLGVHAKCRHGMTTPVELDRHQEPAWEQQRLWGVGSLQGRGNLWRASEGAA